MSNSQSTRAREKTGMLNSSEPLLAPRTQADADRRKLEIQRMRALLKTLTPATRRMLFAIVRAVLTGYSETNGYSYRPANRQLIADHLGRRSLYPHDRELLRKLVELKLVVEQRQALPRKQYGEIMLGAGAEYVYSFETRTLFLLLYLDDTERDRIDRLTANIKRERQLDPDQHRPARPARPVQPPATRLEQRDPFKLSLVDTIRDLFGF